MFLIHQEVFVEAVVVSIRTRWRRKS